MLDSEFDSQNPLNIIKTQEKKNRIKLKKMLQPCIEDIENMEKAMSSLAARLNILVDDLSESSDSISGNSQQALEYLSLILDAESDMIGKFLLIKALIEEL